MNNFSALCKMCRVDAVLWDTEEARAPMRARSRSQWGSSRTPGAISYHSLASSQQPATSPIWTSRISALQSQPPEKVLLEA